MENIYKSRRGINVSTSVRGVKTYDATVEIIDDTNEEVNQWKDIGMIGQGLATK